MIFNFLELGIGIVDWAKSQIPNPPYSIPNSKYINKFKIKIIKYNKKK